MNDRLSLQAIIGRCTQDPDNCPVVAEAFEADISYAETTERGIIDIATMEAEIARQNLANYVMACASGLCPGRNPATAEGMDTHLWIQELGD